MKYSISISGTGIDPDDGKDVFENVVRALRTIGSDKVEGSFSAANNDGSDARTLAATDVGEAEDDAEDAPSE